eukprot:11857557-Karenia_brevis.AAC.1
MGRRPRTVPTSSGPIGLTNTGPTATTTRVTTMRGGGEMGHKPGADASSKPQGLTNEGPAAS